MDGDVLARFTIPGDVLPFKVIGSMPDGRKLSGEIADRSASQLRDRSKRRVRDRTTTTGGTP